VKSEEFAAALEGESRAKPSSLFTINFSLSETGSPQI
jgi:hypothetical protein